MEIIKRVILTAEEFIYKKDGVIVSEEIDYMDAPQRLSDFIKENAIKELVVSDLSIIRDSYRVEETSKFEGCKLILDYHWFNEDDDREIEDWLKLED